jgi:pyruvate/2-oxoglutarate dehydrogenase complex dihydrolipoamide acyltransferase (E2) component
MNLTAQKEFAAKAFYAAVGAPVVAGRKMKDYMSKFAEYGDKMTDEAQERFDEWAKEGEKFTKQLQDRNMVEEIQHAMDLDKVQDRVEKLRDQLESALDNWRESFAPGEKPAEPAKPAPKAAPAAKKAPAKKAPAAKKTTPKTTAKKAPARKAPARKPAAKPAARKTTTASK